MRYRIGDTICIKVNGKIYSNLFVSGSVRSSRVYFSRVYFLRKNYSSWRGDFSLDLAICQAMHREEFLFSSKQVLIEKVCREYNMTL